MKHLPAWLWMCALCVACEEHAQGTGLNAASAERDAGADAGEVQPAAYFAVVSSNYMGATSISLLGRDGRVVDAEWVGSKTKNPDLRTPLAEDVVLPTTSPSRHYLTTIERGLGVITRFDLDSGEVLGQLRTDVSPERDEAAYHSNPQDVLYTRADSAWVSRWAPNPDPNAEPSERGDDLIEFDPQTLERTERRIDLSQFDAEIDEMQVDKEMHKKMVKSVAYARPASLVRAGEFVVVGLVRMTEAYNYAAGMLAVIDPEAGALVDSLALDDLSNCGSVRPVLDEPRQVLVECLGAYGDDGQRSGIVRVRVDDAGKPHVVDAFRVAEHEGAVNGASNVWSLGGPLAVAVAYGELDSKTNRVQRPDAAYLVHLDSGEQTLLIESEGAFSLGLSSFDADSRVLLLPDAGSNEHPKYGAHRFVRSADGDDFEPDGFEEIAPDTTLAAREIRHL